jgi:hypothetical protein
VATTNGIFFYLFNAGVEIYDDRFFGIEGYRHFSFFSFFKMGRVVFCGDLFCLFLMAWAFEQKERDGERRRQEAALCVKSSCTH